MGQQPTIDDNGFDGNMMVGDNPHKHRKHIIYFNSIFYAYRFYIYMKKYHMMDFIYGYDISAIILNKNIYFII